MTNEGQILLIPAPDHACEPVAQTLEIIRNDLEKAGNNHPNPDMDISISNTIAGLCGKLCQDGCARRTHFEAESAGLVLPPSKDREVLFEMVSGVLGIELIFGDTAPEPVKEADEEVAIVELEIATGAELKEIYDRRMAVFKEPELLGRLGKQCDMTGEEMGELFASTHTPVREETFDELAKLVHGNVRAALAIMSYFQQVFPVFASMEPEFVEEARSIDDRGFRPGNPWEIGPIDVAKIGAMMDDTGLVRLPISSRSAMWVYVSENPDETRIIYDEDAETIDVVPSSEPITPSIITKRAELNP